MVNKSIRVSIIEAIRSPLGFFVLALLIVEGFIALVLIKSDLNELHKFIGMLIGVILFLLLVIVVGFLVWFKPKNLTYSEAGHQHSEDINHHYDLVKMKNSAKVKK